jgi:hypothetical protein
VTRDADAPRLAGGRRRWHSSCDRSRNAASARTTSPGDDSATRAHCERPDAARSLQRLRWVDPSLSRPLAHRQSRAKVSRRWLDCFDFMESPHTLGRDSPGRSGAAFPMHTNTSHADPRLGLLPSRTPHGEAIDVPSRRRQSLVKNNPEAQRSGPIITALRQRRVIPPVAFR